MTLEYSEPQKPEQKQRGSKSAVKRLVMCAAAMVDDVMIRYYRKFQPYHDGPCGRIQAWARKNRKHT